MQSIQKTRKGTSRKMARRMTTLSSLLGALAAIVGIIQFAFPHVQSSLPLFPSPQPTVTQVSLLSPTSMPTPTPTLPPTPTSTPIPTLPPIHLVECSAASTEDGILKFFTQEGSVVCFSGSGTMTHIIQPVVRVETGTTFATWLYVTLGTGVSHHSPQYSSYNCPGKIAHYSGASAIQITQITIAANATACS